MSKLKGKLPKEGGFTIIEVVLVLAIAGLIFLIVFLALPQLQQSRRDTQRRNDAGRMLAALENVASNRNGNYPAEADVAGTTWLANNVDAAFNDPDGVAYSVQATAPTATTQVQPPNIWYGVGAECNDSSDAPTTGLGDRRIAVIFGLESGQYCQDNS